QFVKANPLNLPLPVGRPGVLGNVTIIINYTFDCVFAGREKFERKPLDFNLYPLCLRRHQGRNWPRRLLWLGKLARAKWWAYGYARPAGSSWRVGPCISFLFRRCNDNPIAEPVAATRASYKARIVSVNLLEF